MSPELYAIVSMAARYWFSALILFILIRAWRMTVKDNRRSKLIRDWSPEAGCIGQFVVNPGKSKKQIVLPVPREGVLGSSRRADISVKVKGHDVRRFHFSFEARPGGLLIKPLSRAKVIMNDRFAGSSLFVQDGDMLKLGNTRLLLVLFSVVREDPPFDEEHIWADPLPPLPQKTAPEKDRYEDSLQAFEDELWPDD